MKQTPTVDDLIDNLTEKLQTFLNQQYALSASTTTPNPTTAKASWALIGIHTGGLWVAECLHQRLALDLPLGKLDISFYRDDFTRIGLHPQVKPSELPFEVEGKNIILVDDVLHTGRTIRAAMNEIFDYGRPHAIYLATLVQRSGRELPIHADFCGATLDLTPQQCIKLQGPKPLQWVLQTHQEKVSTPTSLSEY